MERIKAKNPQEKLKQQKELVDGLNKKITKSLGSVTIVASPSVSRQVCLFSIYVTDSVVVELRNLNLGIR